MIIPFLVILNLSLEFYNAEQTFPSSASSSTPQAKITALLECDLLVVMKLQPHLPYTTTSGQIKGRVMDRERAILLKQGMSHSLPSWFKINWENINPQRSETRRILIVRAHRC